MRAFLTISICFVLSLYSTKSIRAEEAKLLPAPLLELSDFFSHHVMIAEKSTHLLHLFKNNSGTPELVRTFQMATGKKSGDKLAEGDFKTPEGIYNFVDFLTKKELLKQSGPTAVIYGAGAFVTDYPNPVDKRLKKTGSGIWLHSTNDETRIDKGLDSRGCVVTANNDLIEVSKYLELNKTPIIIVQDLQYLNLKTHETQKNTLKKVIDGWLQAWRAKDIEAYMSYYHPEEFLDAKGNFNRYKAYKKAVFSNPGKTQIDIYHTSIFQAKNYAMVIFAQDYKSTNINDVGRKILYLRQDDNYNWKIISELWSSKGLENYDKPNFTPTLRYFDESSKIGIELSDKGSR